MGKDNHKGDPLWDVEAFFKLPIAEMGEYGPSRLVSRHQPTGILDEDGLAWNTVETNSGLKRQQITSW